MPDPITSSSNERIKRLVRLRDRRSRDAEGVFVVEGDRLFDRAVASGLDAREIYVVPTHPMARQPDVTVVDDRALDRASYRKTSEGLIAVFEQFSTALDDVDLASSPLILVAESIEKPGNLGAMARTASAVGADALVTVGSSVDIFNPNVIRSSTGAIFETPVIATDLGTLVAWLDENAVRLLASSPGSELSYWDADFSGPVALAVGAEDVGHSSELAAAADDVVTIPTVGAVDSLNASLSLGLLAFEAARQRR